MPTVLDSALSDADRNSPSSSWRRAPRLLGAAYWCRAWPKVAEADQPPGARAVGEVGAAVCLVTAGVPEIQGDVSEAGVAARPSAAEAIGAKTQEVRAGSRSGAAGR
jgi:hypothetical protein